MPVHISLKPLYLNAPSISFLPKLFIQVPFVIRIIKSSEIICKPMEGECKKRMLSIKTRLNPLERLDKGGLLNKAPS